MRKICFCAHAPGNIWLTDSPVAMDIRTSREGVTLNGTPCMLVLNNNVDTEDGICFTPDTSSGNGEMYDLSGRRMKKAEKGIVIQNGKKVVIR